MNPTPVAYAHSRKMFEEAIALDRGYAGAYVDLAAVLANGYSWQFSSDPKKLDRAELLARKAVSLDDSDSIAYAVLAWVIVLKNRPDEAITTAERAIALDPNHPELYLFEIGWAYLHMQHYQEAAQSIAGSYPM